MYVSSLQMERCNILTGCSLPSDFVEEPYDLDVRLRSRGHSRNSQIARKQYVNSTFYLGTLY